MQCIGLTDSVICNTHIICMPKFSFLEGMNLNATLNRIRFRLRRRPRPSSAHQAPGWILGVLKEREERKRKGKEVKRGEKGGEKRETKKEGKGRGGEGIATFILATLTAIHYMSIV